MREAEVNWTEAPRQRDDKGAKLVRDESGNRAGGVSMKGRALIVMVLPAPALSRRTTVYIQSSPNTTEEQALLQQLQEKHRLFPHMVIQTKTR